MLYPEQDLQDLYLQHQSVWEEVWEEGLSPEAALDYMRVPAGALRDAALEALENRRIPL